MDKLEEIVKDTRTTLECLMNPGMRADKEDLVEIRKGFEAVVAEVERQRRLGERYASDSLHWARRMQYQRRHRKYAIKEAREKLHEQ